MGRIAIALLLWTATGCGYTNAGGSWHWMSSGEYFDSQAERQAAVAKEGQYAAEQAKLADETAPGRR